MIATRGAPATSLTVNSRPASSGWPMVAKKPGPTRVDARVHVFALLRLVALDLDRAAPVAVGHQRDHRRRRRAHVGQLRQLFLQLLEQPDRALARVAVERRVDREAEQLVGLESGVERFQVVEAAREQPGAGEQQHRQPDLRDDQPLAEPRVAGAADHAARLRPSASRSAPAASTDSAGARPKRIAVTQRGGDRERGDPQVGRRGQRLRCAVVGQHLQQQRAGPPRDAEAEHRAGCREQRGFRPAAAARSRRGSRPAPGGSPLPSAAPRRARAAGSRRWRRRSAARARPSPISTRIGVVNCLRRSDRPLLSGPQEQVLGEEAVVKQLRHVRRSRLSSCSLIWRYSDVHRRFRLRRRRRPASAAP